MAETYVLDAQPRTVIGKQVKALRRQNLIPAVIYGAGSEPMHVMVQRRPLEIVLQQAGGTNLVNVMVDGTAHNTIVREVQRDTIRRDILHVDFLQVDLSKTLRTEVQVMLVNVPKLGTDLLLTHNLMSVEVESLPTNIPDHYTLDCSSLKSADSRLTVADLPQFPGVEILTDPDEIIVRVDAVFAAAGEEAEEEAEEEAAEPEVIERGRREEEEDF